MLREPFQKQDRILHPKQHELHIVSDPFEEQFESYDSKHATEYDNPHDRFPEGTSQLERKYRENEFILRRDHHQDGDETCADEPTLPDYQSTSTSGKKSTRKYEKIENRTVHKRHKETQTSDQSGSEAE